ncbi:Receptor expression-enhancing protein 4 [Sarcoptes scabiei]|nr:Receptor expression-enhancing protein 4 [Sarcoptes scabiei]
MIKLIIGCLYPTYLSYKALKNKDGQELTRLLTYWVVFTVFSILEGFFDILIGFWLPFYYESKLVFMLWLISPYGNGATILYETFLSPKFNEHEELIDDCIDNIKESSIKAFWKLWNKFTVYFNQFFLIFLAKAQLAALDYVYNQRKLYIDDSSLSLSSSTIPNFNFGDGGNQPIIETIDTEENDENKHILLADDTEIIKEKKKPVKKTRRKKIATIVNNDEDNNNNNKDENEMDPGNEKISMSASKPRTRSSSRSRADKNLGSSIQNLDQ